MAISGRKFVRLPPDSTGKRAGASMFLYLEYGSKTGNFSLGDVVVGQTSTVVGTVLKIEEYTVTTGVLLLELSADNPDGVFTASEPLLVNSVQQAIAATTGEEVFWSENVLVGANNPSYGQIVDEQGAATVRFSEGSPQFDAFGLLKSSESEIIHEYRFPYEFDHENLELKTSGSATASYSSNDSSMLLNCTSAAGEYVHIRSHHYHRYQPGIGQLCELSLVVGDTGKDECIRRWGYFDNDDGLFFELSGSVLNVVVRSSAGGTVSETRIPQTEWNGDRLDGSETAFNLSGELLDVSKANLYWIDFQWLGVGNVRFGVFLDSRRVTCHTVLNPNSTVRPYMRGGSLPVSVEQQHVGAAASTSEMRWICGAVSCDGKFDPPHKNFSQVLPSQFYITSSTDWAPLFTGRSAATFFGKDNRTHGYVTSFQSHTTSPIQVQGVKNAALTGSLSWITLDPHSAAEFDLSASFANGGRTFIGILLDGVANTSLEKVFNRHGESIHRKATIGDDPDTYTVMARLVPGSSPATASFMINWEEIQ